ncbi:MAG: hypothetical protein AAB873_01380 [Patescibacteria group bacterium]
MIEIKDLLLRFSELITSEEVKKTLIRDVLLETVGLKIKTEDIKIKNGSLYLNAKPIYKNEILLKRNQIFSRLQEALGKKSPQKII